MAGGDSIAVWGSHHPGEPVSEKFGEEAMASTLCQAEYLWGSCFTPRVRKCFTLFHRLSPNCSKCIVSIGSGIQTTFIQTFTELHVYISITGGSREISPWERDQIYISLVNAQDGKISPKVMSYL